MVEKPDNTLSEQRTDKDNIKRLLGTEHLVVSIICFAFLLWSLWPGSLKWLSFCLFMSTILWFPILLGICVHTIFKIFRQYRTNKEKAKLLFFRFAISCTIVFFALGLLYLEIPQRTAFCFFRASFEQYLEENPLEDCMNSAVNKQLGIWTVDQYAKDSRGGTYFRIGTELDMIDTTSYGFAFSPNKQGTPFGNAQYYKTRIIGDWCYFSASDDW